ncbi:aminodeoxychorismate synthase, component I [Longibacter salinarum]|uniref:Aminodeoxychorismate synthase, component I n=1 Tax=Longibacter salinarum TaxID=1850348 RepID=A0A2A8CW40_9BACT|nr:aminodeoxychorismate synthase component I [Longibacter salinarum]PEN12866.1 aminodeoxychorismate synthase, component I [Longibacter salinarum]
MPQSEPLPASAYGGDGIFRPDRLDTAGTVFLDTSRPPSSDDGASGRRSLLFERPRKILRADARDEVADVLRALDAALASGYYVAGMLTYEAGLALCDMSAHALDGPLAWFGVYESPVEVPHTASLDGFNSLQEYPSIENARFDVSRDMYRDALRQIKSLIREGDVYQINYTGPVRFTCASHDPIPLYAQLRKRQPVPYGAWLRFDDRRILCASPELFVRREGKRLVTKPMKGTIRRGMTQAEDEHLRFELANDSKSQAENLMIVDLLRNDLSICCEPGSVNVPSLFATETYDTLTQMTSTVEGRLTSDTRLSDILKALYPCGSVTGAPKRRAMQRIHELETGPRGVYCGAIGYAAPDDTACFNVAIRTVTLTEDASSGHLHGTMGTGSGIVWDSDLDAEYEECCLKARFLTDPPRGENRSFRLIETMRAIDGDIPLWSRHWSRLSDSAAYFGLPVDRQGVEVALRDAMRSTGNQENVVRLTVGQAGDPRVEIKDMPSRVDSWSLAIATEPARPTDPFFYHKTTRRAPYTRAQAQATEVGCDEAILMTPDGEVTEGARSNVIIEIGGRWVTPPVEAGLLGGVFRAHLLETEPRLEVGRVMIDDLMHADRVFCCNAVRGLIPAHVEKDLRPPMPKGSALSSFA